MFILNTAALIFVFMNAVFILAVVRRDNSIVDIGWGLGFIVVAAYHLLTSATPTPRQILVSALILLWGLRLGFYIYSRNKGKGEDFRYAKMRRGWGKFWLERSYLQVFILQGLLMFTIVYPVIILHYDPVGSLNWLDGLGTLVWLAGFCCESLADYQKSKFKQEPSNKGKVMDRGIWKFSRHPNYFGESLMWWGVFLIVLSAPEGGWAVFSPLIITFLLTRVSGIPLIEKHHKNDPDYQDYIRRTSAFIPWKPRG
jgi:steroid 5-alpha reductase family enzyme